MFLAPVPQPSWPENALPLEEARAAGPRDMAATVAFALDRIGTGDGRPVLLAALKDWQGEFGRPYRPGLKGRDLILTVAKTPVETLWAMEQALRSGAVAAVLGAVDGATLTQTRRLDFAAREGGAIGVMLPSRPGDLSAAGRRWVIQALPSGGDPHDVRAPGPLRLSADLTRSRDGRPGAWILEQDDETHRLRLADRLAGDGVVETVRRATDGVSVAA